MLAVYGPFYQEVVENKSGLAFVIILFSAFTFNRCSSEALVVICVVAFKKRLFYLEVFLTFNAPQCVSFLFGLHREKRNHLS